MQGYQQPQSAYGDSPELIQVGQDPRPYAPMPLVTEYRLPPERERGMTLGEPISLS